jgi:hypothetical protein
MIQAMIQPGQIFISYAREDYEFARALAKALDAKGFTAWWDFRLLAGHHFREEIISKIDAATAVIVVWSPSSVISGFVLDEASRAARQNKLVPLSILGAQPPLGFGHLHTLPVNSVSQDIGRILATLEQEPRSMPLPRAGRKNPRLIYGAALAGILLSCVGAGYLAIDDRQFDSMINCFKYGCALDYITYRSKSMRLQFVYPMHHLMLDTTQENLQRLPMLNAKGEIEVEIFRTPLPVNRNPIQGSALSKHIAKSSPTSETSGLDWPMQAIFQLGPNSTNKSKRSTAFRLI